MSPRARTKVQQRLYDELVTHVAEAVAALRKQMLDAGFKALAMKLHPDKGGSTEEMARLNRVRRTA